MPVISSVKNGERLGNIEIKKLERRKRPSSVVETIDGKGRAKDTKPIQTYY